MPFYVPEVENPIRNELTDIVGNIRVYQTGMTFAKPFHATGRVSNWYKICCYVWLRDNGKLGLKPGATKQEIVEHLFNKSLIEHPGWYSSVFAGLHQGGLIKYNAKTRKWYAGEKLGAYISKVQELKS